jgi:hypothetical protein
MAKKAEKFWIGNMNRWIGLGILAVFIGLIGLGVYASTASSTAKQANMTIEKIRDIGQPASHNAYRITDNDCLISFSILDSANGSNMPPIISGTWLNNADKRTQSCEERFFGDEVEGSGIAVYRKINDHSRSITFWVFTVNSTIPASQTFLYN